MSAQNPQIKCAKCKVPLQGPADAQPQDRFACPSCGEGDSLDNILREVGEVAGDQAADFLERGMRRAARQSGGFIKIKEQPRGKRSHRFIVDLEL